MNTLEMGKAKMGRPRCFCEETALDAAMRLFWKRGYVGTSLTDLTEAMGINRASLYSTFGDKESLFRKALVRYGDGPGNYLTVALEELTARSVIETLLRGAANVLGDPKNPRGCLSTQGALATGLDAEPIKIALIELRKGAEERIQRRFRRAKMEGDLPNDVNVNDLARYISNAVYGLGVLAANGNTKAEMMRVVEMTIRSLSF